VWAICLPFYLCKIWSWFSCATVLVRELRPDSFSFACSIRSGLVVLVCIACTVFRPPMVFPSWAARASFLCPRVLGFSPSPRLDFFCRCFCCCLVQSGSWASAFSVANFCFPSHDLLLSAPGRFRSRSIGSPRCWSRAWLSVRVARSAVISSLLLFQLVSGEAWPASLVFG
jgi:hypothetical protein